MAGHGAVTVRAAPLEIEAWDGAAADWDDVVRADEASTFCHLAGWREIMTEVLGHETRYLVARAAGGEPDGVLPLVRVRSRLFGDYLLSMPFLNDGGPLGTPEARAALAGRAAALARDLGVDLLELRVRTPLGAAVGLSTSDRKITVMLDLPPDAETLWSEGLRAKVRSQVRRPMKAGMQVRYGADQVEPFYEVFRRHMRDLGTPVLPRAFFERIAAAFAGEAEFAAVYQKDTAVAAGCGFHWNGEYEITWASALREHSREAPNMLLYWSLMERAIERGARRFNFGRCTAGGNTHRFKLQWGGEDVPLPWATWSAAGVAAPPSPERFGFRLATRLWSRLPLSLASGLGPVLARRLP